MGVGIVVTWVAVGVVAGWLAGQFLRGSFGLLGDVALGIVGSIVATYVGGLIMGRDLTAAGFTLQTVVVAFDAARALQTVRIQVEEHSGTRTQRIKLSVSCDSAETYEELPAIEFLFTPYGATFQERRWVVAKEAVTHLRLQITPSGCSVGSNAGGRASLTSIVLS